MSLTSVVVWAQRFVETVNAKLRAEMRNRFSRLGSNDEAGLGR
jgi:hypothetical protein